MKYVIKVYGLYEAEPFDGQMVKSYAPEAFEGLGDVETTSSLSEALKFDTLRKAVAFSRQPASNMPMRPDGKPNRPLTAFTLEFVPVDDDGTLN